ncbi:MAG: hypothetical protein EBZ77_11575, partial [Chitinophagia bacterium]|nr:hypothetical protein [Chitinophagia bacterium]
NKVIGGKGVQGIFYRFIGHCVQSYVFYVSPGAIYSFLNWPTKRPFTFTQYSPGGSACRGRERQ